VGRERELRLIKELFHACADDRRAHLVSVTGIAGIGKSRLVWEFYKYFDGIVDTVWWHRGRCLARSSARTTTCTTRGCCVPRGGRATR
jgi:AAA ATPase domain